MGRTITIKQGEEFKVSVSGDGIVKDDFFYPQYQQAAIHVEEIVNAIVKEKNGYDNFVYDSEKEYLNNIIAFCGERGSGKTTAMKTFSYALCCNDVNNIFGKITKGAKFCNMKTIDPSCFESIHDVLSIVVARMFKDFETIYDKDESKISDNMKFEMLSLFQVVYRNLTMLQNSRKYIDQEYEYDGDVQKLSSIASSASLKEHLYALIKTYLTFKKSDFLVIMIDDIDLNIQSAYKLSEEIRRYLSIPNVVIIMAVRIEQLNYCIKKELANDFGTLINMDKKYDLELNVMTNKYLNKLIPESRRIILPDLRDSIESIDESVNVNYCSSDKGKGKPHYDYLLNEKNEPLESTILKYIYKATGAMLIHKEGSMHPIIPSTLRELVMLYDYLGDMIILEEMTPSTYLKNLTILHDYILNVWSKNNLNTYLLDIIKSWDTKRIEDKNKYMCEQIQLMVDMFKLGQVPYEFRVEHSLIYHEIWIFNKEDYAKRQSLEYSFSFGEVLNLFMDLNELVEIEAVDNFVSCALMLYTILLNTSKIKDEIQTSDSEDIQPNLVNSIIAGDLWGKRLEDVLNKQKSNNGLVSRVIFNYDIIKYLREHLKLELNDNKKLQISNDRYEKIIQEEETKYRLYMLVSISHFGTKNSDCLWNEQLIADNWIIKSNAVFKLDNLFLMGIDPHFTWSKMGVPSESQENNMGKADLDKLLSFYGLNDSYFINIVYNPELSKHILEEVKARNINTRLNLRKQSAYSKLMKNIERSSKNALRALSYEEIEKSDSKTDFKNLTDYLDDLSSYFLDSKIKISMPPRITVEISASTFIKRCNRVINLLDDNKTLIYQSETYKNKLKELIKADNRPTTPVNPEDDKAKEYNVCWDILAEL